MLVVVVVDVVEVVDNLVEVIIDSGQPEGEMSVWSAAESNAKAAPANKLYTLEGILN